MPAVGRSGDGDARAVGRCGRHRGKPIAHMGVLLEDEGSATSLDRSIPMTDEVISPLRRRMIEDMTIRKLTPKTQQGYIRTIKNLAAFIGRSPDKASFEDVRRCLLHLWPKVPIRPLSTIPCRRCGSSSECTLKRYAIVEHTRFIDQHQPRRLPLVLSAEERVAPARCGTRAQIQSGLERGLWSGSARLGSSFAQDLRHCHRNRIRTVRQGSRANNIAQLAHLLAAFAA